MLFLAITADYCSYVYKYILEGATYDIPYANISVQTWENMAQK